MKLYFYLLIVLTVASVSNRNEAIELYPGHDGCTSLASADFNNDGLCDIAVFEGGKHATTPIFAWFEAPDWNMHELNDSFSPAPFIGQAASADIDKDGYIDIVIPNDHHSGPNTEGSVYWLKNPGSDPHNTWEVYKIATLPSPSQHIGDIELADMDNDGLLDVVTRDLYDNQNSPLKSKISIFFQNSPTDWEAKYIHDLKPREGLALGDIDRDGLTDIILNGFWLAAPVNPRTDRYYEYIIDSFHFSQNTEFLFSNSTKHCIADLNNDGIKDVAIATAEGKNINGQLAWYACPENPREQAWEKHFMENINNCHQLKAADMNLDGTLDLVGGQAFGNNGVWVWLLHNKSQSFDKQIINANYGIYNGVVGDVDADGDFDIIGPDDYAGIGDDKILIHINPAR